MQKKTRGKEKAHEPRLVSFLHINAPKTKEGAKIPRIVAHKLMEIYFVCLLSIWTPPNFICVLLSSWGCDLCWPGCYRYLSMHAD